MTAAVRRHRLVVLTVSAVVLLLAAGATVLATSGTPSAAPSGVLGPGPVTVTIGIDHSRFDVRTRCACARTPRSDSCW